MSIIPALARPVIGNLISGQIANQLGKNPLQAIGGAIGGKEGKAVGKKIEGGLKKVGGALKKVFHFNEGGKVRRPPVAYRKGGSVVGGKGAIVVRKRGRK